MVITLIGYRGTGKSTVGKELAKRLDWDFVDTDQEIERRAGKTIASIFSEDGEPAFRALEREELSRQLFREHLIISAGGGAILDQSSRQNMTAAGPVVWLQASVEVIVERLRSDQSTAANRPALTQEGIYEEIATVLGQREQYYSEAATIILNTDGRAIANIVDDIVAQIPRHVPNPGAQQ